MKFKIGDKVVIEGGLKWSNGSEYKTITDIKEVIFDERFLCYHYYVDSIDTPWGEDELELVEGEGFMGKSFLEVISNIEEGEVWESDSLNWDIKSIAKIGDFISIKKRNDSKELCIRPDCKFILKKKEYSFNESFKEYEKGNIEIENIETGTRYKKIDGKDMVFSNLYKKWADLSSVVLFSADDLRGKWYINN